MLPIGIEISILRVSMIDSARLMFFSLCIPQLTDLA